MKCPLCDKKGTQNHLRYCKENISNLSMNEMKKLYLVYNQPELFTYDNLVDIYINQKLSLPEIKEKYGVSYKTTLFMLDFYKIKTRSKSEAFLNSNDKRENTNIERYGAKNVLTKGTIKYDKKVKTIKEKYGVDNVFQIPEVIEKINDDNYYLNKYGLTLSNLKSRNGLKFWKSLSDDDRIKFLDLCNTSRNKTFFENYGQHPRKDKTVNDKIIKTNMEKYGKEFYFQTNDFINNNEIKQKVLDTKISKGYIVEDFNLEPFIVYKRNCRRLTNKVKKELYDNWNGYDYYDNEYIKNNTILDNTNRLYPTMDHKISILHGFINGIDESVISNIDNLCITKRCINSSKGSKIIN